MYAGPVCPADPELPQLPVHVLGEFTFHFSTMGCCGQENQFLLQLMPDNQSRRGVGLMTTFSSSSLMLGEFREEEVDACSLSR